ncbi:Oxidoreductase N-terminal [Penicillium sp. IBT 35674x]|nr:Oxidoreductase N-terminal [Penicillium sp. IBT 35674x]
MKEPQIPPPDIPQISKPPRATRYLVIGAGSRGNAYARAVTRTTPGTIHAVAEPHAFKRREFGRNYIWGAGSSTEGQEFTDWREWVQWETERRKATNDNENGTEDQHAALNLTSPLGIDGVFICTLDETHVEIIQAIAPLNVHILCEKPLALSLDDCLTVYRTLQPPQGSNKPPPSLRNQYSQLDMFSATAPITSYSANFFSKTVLSETSSHWNIQNHYVRGNWRRATAKGDGSLLMKSCHDIDFILWLLCSPISAENAQEEGLKPHFPRSISSAGSLTQFRRKRKPVEAGDATNCLSCPAEKDCNYSAVRIYNDRHLAKGHTGWPVDIVCPDIEDAFHGQGVKAAEAQLLAKLSEDWDVKTHSDAEIAARPWYGRCVYEADNDVVDDQVVTVSWDDEVGSPYRLAKTASFHMIAPTEKQCERRGRVYGTLGEIEYDSHRISIYDFASAETTVHDVPKPPPERAESHGGGDYGLAGQYVAAVEAVVNGGMDIQTAQARFVGCTLEEAVRSHAVVFAAEEARREERVVRWGTWWEEKLRASAAVLA